MGVVLKLNLTARVEDGLARLTARTGLSTEAVATQAIERFVVDELATLEGIEAALGDMRQGRIVAHQDVLQAIEARVGQANAPEE